MMLLTELLPLILLIGVFFIVRHFRTLSPFLTKTNVVIVIILLMVIIGSQSNNSPTIASKPNYSSVRTAEEVTMICAKEAGIDVNLSQPITM